MRPSFYYSPEDDGLTHADSHGWLRLRRITFVSESLRADYHRHES
jgi:hypothetical protein